MAANSDGHRTAGALRCSLIAALAVGLGLLGGCGGGDEGDEPVTVWAPLGMGLIRLNDGRFAGRLYGTSVYFDALYAELEAQAAGLHPTHRRCSTDTLMRGGKPVALAKGVAPVYVLFDIPAREWPDFELYGYVRYTEGDEALGRPFWPCENEGPPASQPG